MCVLCNDTMTMKALKYNTRHRSGLYEGLGVYKERKLKVEVSMYNYIIGNTSYFLRIIIGIFGCTTQ